MTAEQEETKDPREGLTEAVNELRQLHKQLGSTPAKDRSQVYARCIPWLTAAKGFNGAPLPAREITALIKEVDWHLRSLAGLVSSNTNTDDEHTAWALAGLDALTHHLQPNAGGS